MPIEEHFEIRVLVQGSVGRIKTTYVIAVA